MSEKKTLLIIEDDPGLQKQYKWSFPQYKTVIAGERKEAIKALNQYKPNVVMLDLGLPPDPANATEGLKTLKEIRQLAPATKVIVVTGNDDRDVAVESVSMGAYDFYQKPIDIDVLNMILMRAFQLYELETENLQLQQRSSEPLAGIIATSKTMLELTRMVEKIAPTDMTALLLGESGTGKEVIANAIHNLSFRAEHPFIAINCAAIPENLLESELFGYEKGAFTGAVKSTKGKIEYADKGSFLMDEIGDMPMTLQSKLLRFLQQRTIERIGGREEIAVDVRIICATHQNLQELIDQGKFRSDLYYRISEMTINIPPLREREGDVIAIATNLLSRFNKVNNKNITHFSNEAVQAIEAYQWPGNIRELENKIKRAVVMAEGNSISLADLNMEASTNEVIPFDLQEIRAAAEYNAINRALKYADQNVASTAKLLGITRPTLYALIKKLDINIS